MLSTSWKTLQIRHSSTILPVQFIKSPSRPRVPVQQQAILSEELRTPVQDTFDRIQQLLVPFDAFVRATPRQSQRRDERFFPSVSNGLQRAIQFPTRATIHPSVSLHSRSRIVSVGIVLVERDSLNCAYSLQDALNKPPVGLWPPQRIQKLIMTIPAACFVCCRRCRPLQSYGIHLAPRSYTGSKSTTYRSRL